MANAFESITKVITHTGYTVRVWSEEEAEGAYDATHNAITELVRDNAANPSEIATAIRTLENWAAYEVIDRYGNGRVVYREWP
jgi:hypothetical protein